MYVHLILASGIVSPGPQIKSSIRVNLKVYSLYHIPGEIRLLGKHKDSDHGPNGKTDDYPS